MGRSPSLFKERDKIMKLRKSGQTYKKIGEQFNVTRQRIEQIVRHDQYVLRKAAYQRIGGKTQRMFGSMRVRDFKTVSTKDCGRSSIYQFARRMGWKVTIKLVEDELIIIRIK